VPIYRYEVTDTTGKTLRGAMDAPSVQEVEARLSAKGYRAIHVHSPPPLPNGTPAPTTPPISSSSSVLSSGWVFGSPKPQELASFFRQIASLLHAGFTVSAAFGDLGQRTPQRSLRNAALAISAGTANGGSLAGQMLHFSSVFPAHVIGLADAGERGGFLEFAFEEAALWAEQEAVLYQGLWVPRFFFWQSIWSVLLFQPLFPSLNIENVLASLGKYGQIVLFLCIPIGIALHLLSLFIGWLRVQPSTRPFFDSLSLRLPVAARFSKMQALAAFTRVLRRLLMSGIAPEMAYIGAANAVPNSELRRHLLQGAGVLRSGQGLDVAIQSTGLMDADPLNRLITGQKTGQWQEMLEQITVYYQEEAARAMEGVKSAQRRAATLITIITSGYILIATTYGFATLGFKFTEEWTK
jgi:type II secretory pathway component PulF